MVGPKVFINFRGELRKTFVTHLRRALRENGITAYIDTDEQAGENLDILLKRIQESTVALAILSSGYTCSRWCLKELVEIMACVDRKELWVIPIFYQLDPFTVKSLDGDFGVQLWDLWREAQGRDRDDRIVKWNEALQGVAKRSALVSENSSDEITFLKLIIKHVQNALTKDLTLRQNLQERGRENPNPEEDSIRAPNRITPGGSSLKHLEQKLNVECTDNETRVVGIVGMAGIGKTYLAEKLYVKLYKKIARHVFIEFDREKRVEQGLHWVQKRLVEGLLLKQEYSDISVVDVNALECWKNILSLKKIVVILDNVIDEKQIDVFLSNCDWIKKGSRIVITTRDKSLLKRLNCDLYEVSGMNDREGLEIFKAQIGGNLEESFMEMTKKFLEYAGGNCCCRGEAVNNSIYWGSGVSF